MGFAPHPGPLYGGEGAELLTRWLQKKWRAGARAPTAGWSAPGSADPPSRAAHVASIRARWCLATSPRPDAGANTSGPTPNAIYFERNGASHRFRKVTFPAKKPAASAVPLTTFGSKVDGIGLTPAGSALPGTRRVELRERRTLWVMERAGPASGIRPREASPLFRVLLEDL